MNYLDSLSSMDLYFIEVFLEFLASYFPLLIMQVILMLWILTLNIGDSLELNWRKDLANGLSTVGKAIKKEKVWFAIWLIANAIVDLTGMYDGEKQLSTLSLAMSIPLEIIFLRIQWQIIKQQLAQENRLNEDFQDYSKVLIRLFFLDLIIGVMIALAIIFFILPGVILAVYLSLSLVICCFKGKGILKSISESFELINGVFIRVCNYILPATLLLALIPSLILTDYYHNMLEVQNITLAVPFTTILPMYVQCLLGNFTMAAWALLTLPLSVRIYTYLTEEVIEEISLEKKETI